MANGFQDLLGALLKQGLANPRLLEAAAKQLGLGDLLQNLASPGGLAGALGGLMGQGGGGGNPLDLIRQLAGGDQAPAHDPEERAKVLLLAMILAAKADGKLGPEETARILAKLDEIQADPEVRAYVYKAMAEAEDPAPLIEAGKRDPALAREIFAASVLAVRVDTPAESRYLGALARGLGLDRAEVERILAQAGLA